jgi:hypothetical protein
MGRRRREGKRWSAMGAFPAVRAGGPCYPQLWDGVRRMYRARAAAALPEGRRFPTCRHCKGISFELAHAAKHVGEIDYLEEAHAPAQ